MRIHAHFSFAAKPRAAFLSFALALGLSVVAPSAALAASLWSDVAPSQVAARGERQIVPDRARAMALNYTGMADLLASAPHERDVAAPDSPLEIELPLPEGGYGRFRVVESPVMEAALAKRYPMLKTYLGQGIDNPTATARLDLTVQGFRAQVIANTHSTYIEPYQKNDVGHYVVFNKSDYRKAGDAPTCGVTGDTVKALPNLLKRNNVANISSGTSLRTYRLAVAATGEYTAVLGGTVLDGLSGIVTTINRVNGIYERELAVRMVLVANNDLLVYTNSATDPYTNGNGSTMLDENQSNLNAVIGNANYDIGHVFSTGGGGVAGLGVVCNSTQKGRGVTGSSNPIADAYDVDFVAHEMGHQFAGNHTFNGSGNNCSGGNRNASTAYEVGSGVTIQAYAGICGADNTQPNSEDYFHRGSLNEILAFTTGTGGGATCGVLTTTGNTPPVVTTASAFTIPKSTPFMLTATGTDADGDALTYVWEQFDLGAANSAGVLVDNGGPLFRSFIPSANPTRVFPSLRYILNNANVAPATAPIQGTTTPAYMSGELLPSTARSMNFRVTARDNRAGGGGTSDAGTVITVSATAGPFAVTAPNTAVSWAAGSTQTVTWDVASTSAAPVSTANVEIALSLDGGYTFPIILAASTPNDGAQALTIPAGTPATTQARIRVAAVGNVFFDISDVNFTITGSNTAPTVSVTGSLTTQQGSPATTAVVATVSDAQDSAGSLLVAVSEVPPELTVTVSNVGGSVLMTAAASCTLVAPTSGSKVYPVLLTVTDSGGAKSAQWVNVSVGANLIPTLGTYSNVVLQAGNSTANSPSTGVADGNNNLASVTVSPLQLPGSGAIATVSVASNGVVTINTDSNTTPGIHTVTVRATDTCGAARVRQFTVTVPSTVPALSVSGTQVLTNGGSVLPNACNQFNVTLSNDVLGGATATGVTGTLSSSTSGVTLVQPVANFADIPVGQSRTSVAPFQFSSAATLACGASANFNLSVAYGGGGSPTVLPVSFTVGAPAAAITQNFDGVTAPALPSGWSTSQTGAAPPAAWATTTTSPDSAPNVAFTNGVITVASSSLISPAIALPASPTAALISVRHAWNFEAGWDGGVMELSTDGGATYLNVTSAAVGGVFLAGNYGTTIPTSYGNPIGGQAAWTGVQTSYVTSTLQLPVSLNGQTIRLRFRAGWDDSTVNSGANWRVDGVTVQPGLSCATPGNGACAPVSFTIGGTVSSLVGSGLVLQNNGGDNQAISSNGAFAFTTALSTGATYAVSVLTQPGSPGQTCVVSNGSGTVAATNVSNVVVNCAGAALLNIDDSDAPDVYSPATDGILLVRYLLGLRGAALTQGVLGTNARRNAAQIEAHIAAYLTAFDVDGDGVTRATTDGLLVLRRLLGLSGAALTRGARNGSRSDIDITNAIDVLKP